MNGTRRERLMPPFSFQYPWLRRLGFLLVLAPLLGAVAGCGVPTQSSPSEASAPDPFLDVTDRAGISYEWTPAKRPVRILESVGAGCAFVDVDGDGLLDVLLVGRPRCALYRNMGKGKFTDVTAGSGLEREAYWQGCAVADYDRDGDTDVFLTGYQCSGLFKNDGKGRFTEVTAAAGVALEKWSTAAVFADFDRDGWEDLYVGCYLEFGPDSKQYCSLHAKLPQTSCRPFDYDAQQGVFFLNNRKGGFVDKTREWGADSVKGKCLGASVADYDRDGWPDLFLANDEVQQDLLHNEVGKRFRNTAVEAGVAYSGNGEVPGGMGVDWGDIDNDGRLDLALGTYASEDKLLFRNVNGSFEYASPAAGILPSTLPMVVFGTLLFDYDNDGRKDLLFLNGHTMDNVHVIQPDSSYRQPGTLFRNLDGVRFSPVESASLQSPIVGRGLACGDYDNDGDQDLLLVDMEGRARLLENQARANWLLLDVPVTGAVVRVRSGGLSTIEEVRTGRSYLSACDPRVTVGLGDRTEADSIEVTWPNGEKSVRRQVAANQILRIAPPAFRERRP